MTSPIRVQVALALNLVVFATVLNSVGIVVERSISEWGVDKSVGGTLEGCKDLTIAATSLFLAARVPEWGYRRVMMASLAGVALVCSLLAAVQKFWTVPLMFIVCGAAFALMKVAVYATVGQIAETPERHTALMNRLEGIYQVGAMLAPMIFSWMIAAGNWTRTYWFVAILAGLGWAVWLLTHLPPSPPGQLKSPALGQAGSLLKRKDVRIFLACAWVYVMIEQSLGTWMPTFHREVFGLTPERAAAMLSLYFGSVALSRFLFGYMVRWVPAFRLQMACLAVAFGLLLIILRVTPGAESLPWVYLLSLVGFCIGPIYPTLNSMMLSRLEPALHSSMTGLIIVASALGGTLGSQLLGTLSQRFSTHAAFHFPLLPIAVLGLLLLAFRRSHEN